MENLLFLGVPILKHITVLDDFCTLNPFINKNCLFNKWDNKKISGKKNTFRDTILVNYFKFILTLND